MKRFKVQTDDDHTMLLYYPTQEKAQESYPDAVITEYTDQSYKKYIEQMLAAAENYSTGECRSSTVYILRFNTMAGICSALLYRDHSDGIWYDFCEYQLWKPESKTVPVTKTLSTPAKFCEQFLFPKPEYAVLSVGGKLSKPGELIGIQKFASISFEGVCQCQLFLNGDNLYIKHNDYFSEVRKTGEIDSRTHLPEQCLYVRHAWLRITNFVPLVKILNDSEISAVIWSMIRDFHRWRADEYNMEWTRFLENVAQVTRKYLDEKGGTEIIESEEKVS